MRHISIQKYSTDLIFDMMQQVQKMGLERLELDGHEVGLASFRLRNFLLHGPRCVGCGLKGTHFRKEWCHPSDPRPHLNLYALGFKGLEVLMTVDHIVPKSRGGGNEQRNLQTMCASCNEKKSDSINNQMGQHSLRGVAQPGSATALGAEGREFESHHPDKVA